MNSRSDMSKQPCPESSRRKMALCCLTTNMTAALPPKSVTLSVNRSSRCKSKSPLCESFQPHSLSGPSSPACCLNRRPYQEKQRRCSGLDWDVASGVFTQKSAAAQRPAFSTRRFEPSNQLPRQEKLAERRPSCRRILQTPPAASPETDSLLLLN